MSLIQGGEAQRWRGLMRIFVMICVSLIVGCVSNSPPRQQAKLPRQVTAEGLSGKGLLREPLIPVGNPTLAENMALNEALTQYNVHALDNPCSVGELEAFLKNYPDSPWQASLRLNLGALYHQSGRFTESIAAFKQSWQLMQSCQDPKVKALADRALGELAISLAHWGRYEELEPLLQQSRKRSITGSATEMLTAAREGLYGMKTSPGNSFLCGPYALRSVCKALDKNSQQAQQIIDKVRSTRQGTSLERVWLLSQKVPGLSYQVAFRTPGAPILTPAVMHLKVDHFCAILDPKKGRYPIEDGTAGFFRQHVSMIPAVVDQQATGYFLVPEGKLPSGWRKVSAGEAAKVWGRGNTGDGKNVLSTTTCDVKTGDCGCSPMTSWSIHAMLVSLSLSDTPVGLSNAAFALPFSITYSQRDAIQPTVPLTSHLGPKWTHNYLSFVERQANPFNVIRYLPGGGGEEYLMDRGDFLPSGYTLSGPSYLTESTMRFTGTSYVRESPDGSSDTFGKLIGTRYYLTQSRTNQGLTVSIQYDEQNRISSVTDPVGRVMTFAYSLPSDPLKITSVVDFGGRAAHFTYHPDGHLSSCQDILGLVSSYQWGGNDFIQSLTTPYGTTTFTNIDNSTDASVGNSRVLLVTDPAGRNYRTEFRHSAPGIATSETNVPTGIPLLYNNLLQFRNTFSWEPNQLTGPLDYNKATIYHWLHSFENNTGATSRVLESMKKPLENRIWYQYTGQWIVAAEGLSHFPSHVGRILGDGTTQLDKYQSVRGIMTQHTDPMGRVFDYNRAPNGIDLLSVTTGGQALFSATYDNNHNIATYTDSSGGTSLYTYDSRGSLLTATNALGETTTYGRTPTGNLSSIESPLQSVVTFGWDSQERVASATDSENYTILASYDDADRPTTLTFPDGTTEVITYDRLDVASTKNRRDKVTQYGHDEVQRLTQVTDANNGLTVLGYGVEDAPTSLTDPMSRQTQFVYDLQQRLSVKQYADGATQTMAYQGCCGRLKSVTDALGHTKTFSYFLDNTLKTIDYSGATPDVNFTNDPFLPRPLSMTDGQGVTSYSYIPVGSPGGNALASVAGPMGDTATFSYDIAGRMSGRTVNGASETQNFDPLWRTTTTTNPLDTFTMSYLGTTGQVTGVNSTSGPLLQYAYGTNAQDRRLAQIKNLGRSSGQVLSQFDFTSNELGEITRIVETHGGGSGTPTPTPTNTTTPTPTATPPCDDDDDDSHHHGNHNGHGHDSGHPGNHGNGHHNDGNHGNGNHGNGGHNNGHHGNGHGRGHGGIYFSPDDMRTGTTALVFSLVGLLALYALAQPRTRRSLVVQLTCLGLAGTLALNGCLVGNVDVGAGTTTTYDYAYDNLSQLIGVDINSTRAATFDFDLAGNLQSLTVGNTTTNFTANSLNQRTSPGTNVYDAKGQTTDKDGRTFEWDDDGRMTAIMDGTHRSEFAYDGYGRRIKIAEFDNGNLTSKKLYWWLGGEIVCERDGINPGFPLTKRYFGQGVQVGATNLYYTFDQLGSVRELVDSSGVVRADYRYSTYGERTKVGGDLDSDWGYAGLFHHGPSGLDLATFRTYDSKMGRWISRDPLGEGHDRTLYSYCGNSPINHSDPSGLLPYDGGESYASGPTIRTQADYDNQMQASGFFAEQLAWQAVGGWAFKGGAYVLRTLRGPASELWLAAGLPGADRALAEAIKRLPATIQGAFVFIGHASENSPLFLYLSALTGKVVSLTAGELAAVIRGTSGYLGQDIRLFACYAGKNGLAQQLARALGVGVWGNTGKIGWINGVYYETGQWIRFAP